MRTNYDEIATAYRTAKLHPWRTHRTLHVQWHNPMVSSQAIRERGEAYWGHLTASRTPPILV
jgi:hypothetical protein